MKAQELRKIFLKYFAGHDHAVVKSSTLIPNNDPSVLLTTAGMQQFLPYFTGKADPKKDFKNINCTSVQKCFRTSDIDSVGDIAHLTFFEMLGNFSFGGYFKEGAIDFAMQFLVKEIGLKERKLWATVFSGDEEIDEDIEAIKFWQKHIDKDKISVFGREENWWGPTGKTGPCGPSSEVHYDLTGRPCDKKKKCIPNCNCGRFIEVWNLVFMQYNKDRSGSYKSLSKGQIDTGMGLERVLTVVNEKSSIFDTDVFNPLVEKIKSDSNFAFEGVNKRIRIVADHIKGTIFLISDDVLFSNKEQGYIMRRIFRRAIDQFRELPVNMSEYVEVVIDMYKSSYPELKQKQKHIIDTMNREIETYKKIVNMKIEEVYKNIQQKKKKTKLAGREGPTARKISAEEAFQLYSTYGFSLNRLKEEGYEFDEKEFTNQIDEHKEISKKGSAKKFGGHGIDDESIWDPKELEIMKIYHTATHLLHEALRRVLGKHVKQEGSDINPHRLRFDFQHPSKLTDAEIKSIERIINEQISKKYEVSHREMSYEDAIASGALAFFKEKYPKKVTVYSLGDFSKEICGGPHVSNTGEIKGNFKITSEKSNAAGIRRIKAIVEQS
ncbi:alanine--tRNA ligase [Patescibacteria group bacterium]